MFLFYVTIISIKIFVLFIIWIGRQSTMENPHVNNDN